MPPYRPRRDRRSARRSASRSCRSARRSVPRSSRSAADRRPGPSRRIPDPADQRERPDMDGGGARPGIGCALDPGAADQGQAGSLDPDPARHPDPDPAHQGHLGQGDLRGGQLCLAQIEPGPSDEGHHDDMTAHPPGPEDVQPADRGYVPGRRRAAADGHGAGRGAARRKIGHEAVELGPRAGRGRALHPLAELLQRQPSLAGGLAQPLDRRVPLGVRRPHTLGRLAACGLTQCRTRLRSPARPRPQ